MARIIHAVIVVINCYRSIFKFKHFIRDIIFFLQACIICIIFAAASTAPEVPNTVGYGSGQASHQSVPRPHKKQRSIVESMAFGAAHASVSDLDILMDFTEMQLTLGVNRPVDVGPATVDHHAVTHTTTVAAEFNAHLAGQFKALGAGIAAVADSPKRLYGESHEIATTKRCCCPFECPYCCFCCWRCINFCSACWIAEPSHCTRKHAITDGTGVVHNSYPEAEASQPEAEASHPEVVNHPVAQAITLPGIDDTVAHAAAYSVTHANMPCVNSNSISYQIEYSI